MKLLHKGGTNVFVSDLDHMNMIAAMLIYGKNPSKNLFLWNLGTYFNESDQSTSIYHNIQTCLLVYIADLR